MRPFSGMGTVPGGSIEKMYGLTKARQNDQATCENCTDISPDQFHQGDLANLSSRA